MGHEWNLLFRDLQLEADRFYMEKVDGQHALSLNIQKYRFFVHGGQLTCKEGKYQR